MYTIRVEIKGVEVARFNSEGINSILEDAIKEYVDMPYSCEVGLCEQCSCIAKGDVESNMDSIADGYILTCQTKAKSDIILKYDN